MYLGIESSRLNSLQHFVLTFQVEAVSDRSYRYFLKSGQVETAVVEGRLKEEFSLSRNHITSHYHDRWGVDVGNIDVLVYAAPMTGRK